VDGVLDAPRTQEQVYERARPLIDAVLNGRNCTIFAYGQTSAGKTYTMQV
jgi:DNA replication protein DnaC